MTDISDRIRRDARRALEAFDRGHYDVAAKLALDAMIWSFTACSNDDYWHDVASYIRIHHELPDEARAKLVAAVLTGVPQ